MQPAGLTRREWILRLGQAAALAGFSGAAGDALEAGQTRPISETTAPSALPPGLYEPSGEHMAHVLFRDQRVISPPPGSETEYSPEHATGFQPAFFSAEEFKTSRHLIGLMLNGHSDDELPAGLTAVDDETLDEIAHWIDFELSQAAATRDAAMNLSAQYREIAVHYHGEEGLRRLETGDRDEVWKEGLVWLNQEAHKMGAENFLTIAEAQQLQLLKSISASSSREVGGTSANAGVRFYRVLKTETIRGYYTSRAGLKELDYKGNAFYPESPGCPNK